MKTKVNESVDKPNQSRNEDCASIVKVIEKLGRDF